MPNAIDVVLRLRRITVDDAKRALAVLLTAENAALVAAKAAEALVDVEEEAAADLSAGDAAVEAFAAWLPVGREAALVARAYHEKLGSEVAVARAALSAARAAAEAAEALLERRASERAAEAVRRDQAATDDIISARFQRSQIP